MTRETIGGKAEAAEAIEQKCNEALGNPAFLVACWSVCDGKLTYHGMVNYNFSQADYLAASYHLLQDMHAHTQESLQPPPPLAMADISRIQLMTEEAGDQ